MRARSTSSPDWHALGDELPLVSVSAWRWISAVTRSHAPADLLLEALRLAFAPVFADDGTQPRDRQGRDEAEGAMRRAAGRGATVSPWSARGRRPPQSTPRPHRDAGQRHVPRAPALQPHPHRRRRDASSGRRAREKSPRRRVTDEGRRGRGVIGGREAGRGLPGLRVPPGGRGRARGRTRATPAAGRRRRPGGHER